MSEPTSGLRRASKAHPCPVCGGDHKCSRTADGLFVCGRATGPVPGYAYLGQSEKDPQWGLYREEEDSTSKPGFCLGNRVSSDVPRNPVSQAETGFRHLTQIAEGHARNLTPLAAADLAHRLSLPTEVLGLVPLLGFDPAEKCWTFPEFDATGLLLGLVRRFPDGSKRAVSGSRRGLSLVGGWADRTGPIFLVEGPTDSLALAACHLAAIGRPSNLGGVALLAELLGGNPRPLVVVGENDRKPNGLWPGKDGAKRVAEELAVKLQRNVLCTLPPEGYKDVREWIADRFAGSAENFNWEQLGQEVARDLLDHALTIEFRPADRKRSGSSVATHNGIAVARRKFPIPVPLEDLQLPGPGGVKWLWEGFLARDAVTLFSALPKCGKTTLLVHLLAALPSGGSFCGRALAPGRALVISEEPAGVWAARRDEIGVPNHAVRIIARNAMPRCSNLEEWAEFIGFLADQLSGDPADLVIFDTLANLWPVKDENSAAEVGAALTQFHRLTENRAILAVHHLRKSDGAEGTGSRGSGALAGFADILIELRRQKASFDSGQRRRVLTGFGRYEAIPPEWVIELAEETNRFEHRPEGGGPSPTASRLHDAILALLKEAGEAGLTRKQLWDKLPEAVKRNEARFKVEIESGVGQGWRKEERAARQGGAVYRVLFS